MGNSYVFHAPVVASVSHVLKYVLINATKQGF